MDSQVQDDQMLEVLLPVEQRNKQIIRNISPKNKIAAKKGGNIAKKARLELESKTGKKIISGEN